MHGLNWKIPMLTVLGLSFTGCGDDGIAGTWQAKQIGDRLYPRVREGVDAKIVEEVFLVIDESLAGEYQSRERGSAPEAEFHTGYSVDILVEAMSPRFLIRAAVEDPDGEPYYYGEEDGGAEPVADPSLLFDCELSGDTLNCTSQDGLDREAARFVRKD